MTNTTCLMPERSPGATGRASTRDREGGRVEPAGIVLRPSGDVSVRRLSTLTAALPTPASASARNAGSGIRTGPAARRDRHDASCGDRRRGDEPGAGLQRADRLGPSPRVDVAD